MPELRGDVGVAETVEAAGLREPLGDVEDRGSGVPGSGAWADSSPHPVCLTVTY